MWNSIVEFYSRGYEVYLSQLGSSGRRSGPFPSVELSRHGMNDYWASHYPRIINF
jgi:hypothetical protein